MRSPPRLLMELLQYVTPHRRYAVLTVAFGALGFGLSFAYPFIIGAVVDVIALPGLSPAARNAQLLRLTELALATAILHALVVYGRGHFNVHLGHNVVTDMRRALFDHVQSLSLRFFTKERTGSVLSRVLHDVHEATGLIYTGVIVVCLDALQLVIAFLLLGHMSWKLTVACGLLLPFYGIVFWVMNPRVQRSSERMHAQFSRIAANVNEQLAGQALIKTYTAEARESQRLRDDLQRHHGLVVHQSHDGHLVASAGELLVHLATTIVVGYGGWLALQREITPGTMTRCLGYMLIMFGPVRRFAELNMTYQTSISAMRRVFRIFDIVPSIVDPPRPHVVAPQRGHVRLEGVCFSYEDDSPELEARLDDDSVVERRPSKRNPWALRGVSLEARPGERIAIVGPSGAGKTTLVSLLPRLFDVTQGRVLVDGVDVRDYSLKALRSSIAIVQQDSFVFSGTIRENIAYGCPNASDEAVLRAAVAAHAHEFISRLPEGYESRLGERGVNLSGGQRQRVSIARALLKDPRILILDEATSSLDSESEAIVKEALEVLMRARTCLVVAHRLSTIKSADRIIVLEDGAVVEVGTHDELAVRNGVYARLVRRQTAGA
jgi:ABC-type multidrug transport system fused ATPase/permease subunit